MEINLDRKSRVEPQRQLALNTDNLLPTPEAKLVPNVMPCILLDQLRVYDFYIPLHRSVTGEVTPVSPPSDSTTWKNFTGHKSIIDIIFNSNINIVKYVKFLISNLCTQFQHYLSK